MQCEFGQVNKKIPTGDIAASEIASQKGRERTKRKTMLAPKDSVRWLELQSLARAAQIHKGKQGNVWIGQRVGVMEASWVPES